MEEFINLQASHNFTEMHKAEMMMEHGQEVRN